MAATVHVSSVVSILGRLGSSGAVRVAVLAIPLVGGCYTTALDPDLASVFVCSNDEGDEDACPESLVCVNERCEDPDLLPTLEVLAPEDERSIKRPEVIDMSMGPGPMPQLVPIEVRIRGSLSLVSASEGADPVFGEGHVAVSVDGGEPVIVDAGNLGTSTEVMMVEVRAVAGAHRIVAQALRNDGEPYDNPEATATRLFWLESELLVRPFVAIKSPWPGTVLDVDNQTIEIEIATLNFALTPPGDPPQERRGHAHLFYDDRVRFPECAVDEDCRESYLGVAIGMPPELPIPSSMEQSAWITAALANGDHSLFGFPFPCDPTVPGPLELCAPVFDAIDVVRVDEG